MATEKINIRFSVLVLMILWFYQGFYWQYGSYLLITLAGIFILMYSYEREKAVSGEFTFLQKSSAIFIRILIWSIID